jgi:lipooligosaccharide transport system permease protein
MTAAAVHVFEERLLGYRRTYRGTLFSSFISPALFLIAMGIGLGGFVNRGAGIEGVPYPVFLAPGLLAGAAMQTAAFESTFPILASIRWIKTYHAMLASPVGVTDIVAGQLAWIAVRLTIVTTIFVFVATVLGASHGPTIVLAIPAAVLTGMAFAAPIAAFSASLENVEGFNVLFRFVINPLFLFSGAFFPVSQLPEILRVLAQATPIYHGVQLSRGVVLGTIGPAEALVHVAVLVAFVVIGTAACLVTFRRRLVV